MEIVGSEMLGMSSDVNPNCQYTDYILISLIVCLQINLAVIKKLKPELKNILNMLKVILESSDP